MSIPIIPADGAPHHRGALSGRPCSSHEAPGLTDTNGLYAAVFFIQAARDAGSSHSRVRDRPRIEPAVLLVKNLQGYENLCRLVSDRHCDREFDLTRDLKERREGLIVLSDDERLLRTLRQKEIEDLFVEVSPGYGMARCYAFSRRSGIRPWPPTGCISSEGGSSPSPDAQGRIPQYETLSPRLNSFAARTAFSPLLRR